MKCEYGCDKEALYQLKNGKWCCEKSWNSCEESKRKNKESNIGKSRSEEIKIKFKLRKRGSCMLGKKHSKETIQKYKKQRSGKGNGMFGKHHKKETKEKIGLSSLRFKGENNPMFGKHHKKESLIKIGLKSKEKFLNPEYFKKLKESWNIKPNKPENILINLFKDLNINYEYTGDFSFWIGGKNPDFINHKDKKIIEFFGDHYHSEEFRKDNISNKDHEKNRIEHFKKNNYKCLIIWEHEMNNIEIVIEKILDFNRVKEDE